MANPNMADHIYSVAPQAVSRFLGSKDFARSRKVHGRLCDYSTTGFRVRRVLDETTVEWVHDVRETYRNNVDMQRSLQQLAKALGKRYEVGRRGDVLIVSEKVLKPEVLSFHKNLGVLGTQYVAETDTHRYVVRRHPQDKKQWELLVFTLKPVGYLDPIMIADECVHATCGDLKSWVVDDAHTFLKRVSD